MYHRKICYRLSIQCRRGGGGRGELDVEGCNGKDSDERIDNVLVEGHESDEGQVEPIFSWGWRDRYN